MWVYARSARRYLKTVIAGLSAVVIVIVMSASPAERRMTNARRSPIVAAPPAARRTAMSDECVRFNPPWRCTDSCDEVKYWCEPCILRTLSEYDDE